MAVTEHDRIVLTKWNTLSTRRTASTVASRFHVHFTDQCDGFVQPEPLHHDKHVDIEGRQLGNNGTFTVTITGTSGNLTHSVTISVTVSPGGDN